MRLQLLRGHFHTILREFFVLRLNNLTYDTSNLIVQYQKEKLR